MEENRSRVSRNKATHEACRPGPKRNNKSRFAIDESGDVIECSCKYGRSCTAELIADCVALCCCPCAVLQCFALAFVKAPWMVGKRCLGLVKKERKKTKRIQEELVMERNKDGNLRRGWVEEGMLEIISAFGEAEETESGNASYEAEKVWIELYQIGHLGFGSDWNRQDTTKLESYQRSFNNSTR